MARSWATDNHPNRTRGTRGGGKTNAQKKADHEAAKKAETETSGTATTSATEEAQ